MWSHLHDVSGHAAPASLVKLTNVLLSVRQEYPEVGETLRPLMERYGVQAYFCGHEHNLQYVHVDGEHTHYFLSGGGSKCSAYGFVEEDSRPDLKLFHYGSGLCQSIQQLAWRRPVC